MLLSALPLDYGVSVVVVVVVALFWNESQDGPLLQNAPPVGRRALNTSLPRGPPVTPGRKELPGRCACKQVESHPLA